MLTEFAWGFASPSCCQQCFAQPAAIFTVCTGVYQKCVYVDRLPDKSMPAHVAYQLIKVHAVLAQLAAQMSEMINCKTKLLLVGWDRALSSLEQAALLKQHH